LGEKVVQAETTYSQLLHPDRFIEFQNELRKIPPSEARYAAVKSLDDAMSVTKSAVDTMLNMQLAFTLSIMQAVPVEDQVPAAQIIEQTEAQRPLLYEHYQQMSSESILFTYQNFTLEELGELRAVMEQPAGKQFVHAINEGLEIGIFDASATLGELIVQLHHYQQSAI
jgi:midasin (ATPase involved in ribosome maturation)